MTEERDELIKEIDLLRRNCEGLSHGKDNEAHAEGIKILKSKHPKAYKALMLKIENALNIYLHQRCFFLLFNNVEGMNVENEVRKILKHYRNKLICSIYIFQTIDAIDKVLDEISVEITSLWIKNQSLKK